VRRAAGLIHLASLLVPARRRKEWIREWLAELHYAQAYAGEARSMAFASGAFHDALWQHRDFWTRERVSHLAQSAWFCLLSLSAAFGLIVLASGFLPATRTVLTPLPYRDAQNIATVAQSLTMAMRAGVPEKNVALWREKSKSLEETATYRWELGPGVTRVPGARVSRNFFHLLGAKTNAGRLFERDAFAGCSDGGEDCAVLSYDYWRDLNEASRFTLDGTSYRVAAVLDKGFWFLSPRIALWRIGVSGPETRTGVVARLSPGTTMKDAETELAVLLRDDAGRNEWTSMVQLTGVASRVRSALWSFGLGLGLAIVIVLPSLRMRMPSWNPRAAAFFAAKTGLLLAGVFLCGIEFTHATSITMLGGTDTFTEPLSTWLFMLGSMGVLVWSIADQRRRCRVCLRRLGMVAHVGCPGCLLLNWAGTELVCMEGHGMLHVPEMAASWQDPDRWTSLDDSWQELFERS
jgi:MacB-like periplasmic core domain